MKSQDCGHDSFWEDVHEQGSWSYVSSLRPGSGDSVAGAWEIRSADASSRSLAPGYHAHPSSRLYDARPE